MNLEENIVDAQELRQETELRIPAPLDPHIASVTIRTGTNNPSEYFDLNLSASFGSEYVTLKSGTERFEVRLSIKQAEVKLDTINCGLHVHGGVIEGWSGNQSIQEVKSKNVAGRAKVAVSTGGITPEGRLEIDGALNAQKETKIERAILPWRIIAEDTIQFSHLDDPERLLTGRILDEQVNIRVTPNSWNNKLGVLARLRVRERWLEFEFDESGLISASRQMMDFAAALALNDPKARRRKKLFSKLIRHLVILQLQDSVDTKDATLAASAVVFSPTTEQFNGLPSPLKRREIDIDPAAVERFIRSEEGREIEVLADYGVDFEDVQSDQEDLPEVSTPFLSEFEEVWDAPSPGQYCFRYVDRELLEKCFSLSFGLRANVELSEGTWIRAKVILTDKPHPLAEATEIIELLQTDSWRAHEAAVYFHFLAKGKQAYDFAWLMGFRLSRQNLLSRIKAHSVKSGYGHLVTYSKLAEIAGEGDLTRLAGAGLEFQMYDRRENEEIRFY